MFPWLAQLQNVTCGIFTRKCWLSSMFKELVAFKVWNCVKCFSTLITIECFVNSFNFYNFFGLDYSKPDLFQTINFLNCIHFHMTNQDVLLRYDIQALFSELMNGISCKKFMTWTFLIWSRQFYGTMLAFHLFFSKVQSEHSMYLLCSIWEICLTIFESFWN